MKLLRPISLFVFSCIVSIGTLLFYNIPFFNYVANNSNESLGGRIFLLASLVVIMLAAVTRYAVGLVYVMEDAPEPESELLLLKDMLQYQIL